MTSEFRRIAVRRVIVRTFMTLTLASSVSGQVRNLANTPAAQTQLAIRPIPPEMTQRFQTLHSALQPSADAWVDQQARLIAQQKSPDLPALEAAIRSRFSGSRSAGSSAATNLATGGMQGADIEAMAFLVMMQASQDANQDLQSIMQEVQKQNEQKQRFRQLLDSINNVKSQAPNASRTTPCATGACQSLLAELRQTSGLPHPVHLPADNSLTYADLDQVQSQMKQDLDSMSEMGEMESLRLQMAMDRQSKFMETLSNLLKKVHDTSNSVIQNMK